jgi:hypothetical protein
MNCNNKDKSLQIENYFNQKKCVGKKSSEQKRLRSDNADSSDSNEQSRYNNNNNNNINDNIKYIHLPKFHPRHPVKIQHSWYHHPYHPHHTIIVVQ